MQSNFGSSRDLRIDGVAAGEVLGSGLERPPALAGSCIAVVATDAPVSNHDLQRIARRCGLGLARTGSVAHHGSGEIFAAFSIVSAEPAARGMLDMLFQATVEATEESVLNALWAAVDTPGRMGRVAHALPRDAALDLLERHGRLTAGQAEA